MTTVAPGSSSLVTTLLVSASKQKQITTSKSKQHGSAVYLQTFLPYLVVWLNLLIKLCWTPEINKIWTIPSSSLWHKDFSRKRGLLFRNFLPSDSVAAEKGTAEKRAPNWMGLNFYTSLYTFSTSDGVYQRFSH